MRSNLTNINQLKIKALNFFKSDFFKNVSILTSGSLLGQIILLCFSPVLTRLYLPEQFGSLSLFTSITVILATFATAKYEFAIVLPDNDDDSIFILAIGSLISLVFSLFLFIFFGINESIFISLGIKVGAWWFLLIPINVLMGGINTCLTYWLLRKEDYTSNSLLNLSQSIFITASNLIFGLLGEVAIGLEFSYTLSLLFCFLFLLFLTRKENIFSAVLHKSSFSQLFKIGKRYIDFPKYYLWTHLLSNFTQQMTPVFLSMLYTSNIVGLFALAYRIVRFPVNVVAVSIANVFKNDAMKEIQKSGNSKTLFISTLKRLTLISAPIFILLIFSLPFLFRIIFGEAWVEAGVYAQIMCIMAFCDFISTPLTQSIFVLSESHKSNLLYQLLNISISLFGLLLGFYLFDSAYFSILFFSIGNVAYYLFTLYKAYQKS